MTNQQLGSLAPLGGFRHLALEPFRKGPKGPHIPVAPSVISPHSTSLHSCSYPLRHLKVTQPNHDWFKLKPTITCGWCLFAWKVGVSCPRRRNTSKGKHHVVLFGVRLFGHTQNKHTHIYIYTQINHTHNRCIYIYTDSSAKTHIYIHVVFTLTYLHTHIYIYIYMLVPPHLVLQASGRLGGAGPHRRGPQARRSAWVGRFFGGQSSGDSCVSLCIAGTVTPVTGSRKYSNENFEG